VDWSKYALEKLVYFVAGIVPGFVALLVFQLSHSGLLDSFFRLSYLGYRTKLAFVLMVCFAVGLTITTMVRGLIGAGWAVYTDQTKNQRPYQPSSTFPIAPWRDPRWRTVLAKHLGTGVPNDTVLILPEIFETRRQMVELLPANEQPRALYELTSEKLGTERMIFNGSSGTTTIIKLFYSPLTVICSST